MMPAVLLAVAGCLGTGCSDAAGGPVGTVTECRAASNGWRLVGCPRGRSGNTASEMNHLAVIDARHAWALGDAYTGAGEEGRGQTDLLERWDGTRWTPATPPPGCSGTDLVAGGRSDLWIPCLAKGGPAPLQHGDGTRWNPQPAPGPSSHHGAGAIFAASAHDVWAAATTGLTHWNGHAWAPASWPAPPDPRAQVVALAGSSGTDVWAVGTRYATEDGASTDDDTAATPLAAHWDGHTWRETPIPGTPGPGAVLTATASDGPSSAWAVGYNRDAHSKYAPLVEHWDGHTWSQLPSPNVAEKLTSVVGDGRGGAWTTFESDEGHKDLLLHWNGHTWTTAPPPTPPGYHAPTIRALARVPGTTTLWAAGIAVGDPENAANTGFIAIHN